MKKRFALFGVVLGVLLPGLPGGKVFLTDGRNSDKIDRLYAAEKVERKIPAPADTAAEKTNYLFFHIPPEILTSVIFYHSFDQDEYDPEINKAGFSITCGKSDTQAGLIGRGHVTPGGAKGKKHLVITGDRISPDQPRTYMYFFRLSKDMTENTGFGLLALQGTGFLRAQITPKGKRWGRSFKRPTFVFQVFKFKDIKTSNRYGTQRGDISAWSGKRLFKSSEWHHFAWTVEAGKIIRIYLDGKLKTAYTIKGRSFRPGELKTLTPGPLTWEKTSLVMDELLVLSRVLQADEILSYVSTVKALSARRFPPKLKK